MTNANIVSPVELWSDVPGWKGQYAVSSLGRVKSLLRIVMCGPNSSIPKKIPEKLLSLNTKRGYLVATLSVNSKLVGVGVHRLVALAFLPNPDGKPQVDHINGVRTDNRLENLRWATRIENSRNAVTFPKTLAAMNKAQSSRWRSISQSDEKTASLIAVWPSLIEANRNTGVSTSSIWSCCNGKAQTASGYKWAYVDSSSVTKFGWIEKPENPKGYNPNHSGTINKGNSKSILQIDPIDNTIIAKFASSVQAAKRLQIRRASISACCSGKAHLAGGFIWKYVDCEPLAKKV